MYSQSSSFMGGGNSARPAPGQFGQPQQSFNSFQQPPQQQQQQQQTPFAPQSTGYGGTSLQPQFTGYPGVAPPSSFQAPPQQPQFTGFQAQGPPPQQPSFQPVPQQQAFQPAPVQQIQQIQQAPQPPAAPIRPQQTSSQIAQSFQGASPASSTPVQSNKQSSKIPNIRLSFITATDQAKFEQLFKFAVGDNKALDGKLFASVFGRVSLTISQPRKRKTF